MILTPLVTSTMMPERLEFAMAGSWTTAHSERLERLVDGAAREAAKAQRIAIDMAGIEELDTLGHGCWSVSPAASSPTEKRPSSLD